MAARAHVFTYNGERHFFVVRSSSVAPPARKPLTKAESAVLGLLAGGLSNDEIAKRRHTSPRTVANQVAALLRALDCSSRVELGVVARRAQLR